MAKQRAVLKYAIVLLALFSQGLALGLEPSTENTPPEVMPLKGFGLDQRVKVLGALLLIFAPIGLFTYNKNRIGSSGKESKINILEKKALDQNSSILLVEIHGSTLLLSKTSSGISLIKEVAHVTENLALEEKAIPSSKNVCLVSNNS